MPVALLRVTQRASTGNHGSEYRKHRSCPNRIRETRFVALPGPVVELSPAIAAAEIVGHTWVEQQREVILIHPLMHTYHASPSPAHQEELLVGLRLCELF